MSMRHYATPAGRIGTKCNYSCSVASLVFFFGNATVKIENDFCSFRVRWHTLLNVSKNNFIILTIVVLVPIDLINHSRIHPLSSCKFMCHCDDYHPSLIEQVNLLLQVSTKYLCAFFLLLMEGFNTHTAAWAVICLCG